MAFQTLFSTHVASLPFPFLSHVFISSGLLPLSLSFFFFLNDPAPPELYPLPLHAALPISLAGTTTDDQAPSATVQDADIQAEIRAQIAAGPLPSPPQDPLYFVFPPPQTVVVKTK